MIYPKTNNQEERKGVHFFGYKMSEFGLIFRETANTDVGLDGTVEYVDENGNVTGEIIAVQIKSGISYFNKKDNNGFKFYPDKKHICYWETFPLPVYLILHNPETHKIYYENISRYLKNPLNNKNYIIIKNELKHKNDLFVTSYGKPISINNISTLEELNQFSTFLSTVKEDLQFIENFEELMLYMNKRWSQSIDFNINFLELFLSGLTNLGMHLYFSMQLAYDLADNTSIDGIIGFGAKEHDFLHQYVRFLINQKLANIDYLSYLIDYKDRGLQSIFLAPLTKRGKNFAEFICDYFTKKTQKECSLIEEAPIEIFISGRKLEQFKILRKLLDK
jgi:hypothetical protein